MHRKHLGKPSGKVSPFSQDADLVDSLRNIKVEFAKLGENYPLMTS